jgi:hypothetical protein
MTFFLHQILIYLILILVFVLVFDQEEGTHENSHFHTRRNFILTTKKLMIRCP